MAEAVKAPEKDKPKKYKSDLALIHGEYVRSIGGDKDHDAYVAFFKNLATDETTFSVIDRPMCKIWVTKPEFRNYTWKREWSPKEELDEYSCRYLYRGETIWNALNTTPGQRWRPMGYVNLREQMSSPYVYGADIEYGARIKAHYLKLNGGRTPTEFRTGFLDIETDVNGTEQIILITFINGDGNTYLGALQDFYGNHSLDEIQKMWDTKVEHDFYNALNKKTQEVYNKVPKLKLHLNIFEKEIDLIKWIFDCIHECRPDFVTIWNMDYDIPYILKRIAYRQADPCDILCSPDIPKEYRICNYHVDKGKEGDHITDHWSWLHLTDYTRYVDSMCMYGRLRKAKTKEASYTLNAIGSKEIGAGKLEFGEGEDHHTMQRDHKVEYSVYNIVDVAILRYMEHKNADVRSMAQLIGYSMLEDFSRQSIQLKNMFYNHLEPQQAVPGSVGQQLNSPWDKYISNTGGQVLSPDRTMGTGVPILIESLIISYLHKLVCDIDVSSID